MVVSTNRGTPISTPMYYNHLHFFETSQNGPLNLGNPHIHWLMRDNSQDGKEHLRAEAHIAWHNPCFHLSYSLNSLKGGYIEDYCRGYQVGY